MSRSNNPLYKMALNASETSHCKKTIQQHTESAAMLVFGMMLDMNDWSAMLVSLVEEGGEDNFALAHLIAKAASGIADAA